MRGTLNLIQVKIRFLQSQTFDDVGIMSASPKWTLTIGFCTCALGQ